MADGTSACVSYESFLRAKVATAPNAGFEPSLPLSEGLFPFQQDVVRWALRKGRAALFESFGLGKTRQQIELGRQVCALTSGRFLIVTHLGVRREFRAEAAALGVPIAFVQRDEEVAGPGLYLTNYESIRESKLDPRLFDGVSLDEAAVLRGFGGVKTFREVMATMAGDDRRDASQRIQRDPVRYRFVATATPSPNEHIELLAYAAFLGVMEVSAAKTRFFQRDAEHADHLTLHPHKAEEFWRWVATWSVWLTRPSDADPSYSDEGYVLPELEVRWHEVPTDHAGRAGEEKARAGQRSVQRKMFADAASGVTDAAREARASIPDRVAKLVELRRAEPDEHFLVWHDLEDERRAIERALPEARSVYGTQDLEAREALIESFVSGDLATLAAKPVMLGSGCNLQRHCARAVFLKPSYKANEVIQAVHRLHRFGQTRRVVVDIIYTEAQREIRRALEEKWSAHRALVAQMVSLVRQYGLAQLGAAEVSQDKLTCARQEATGHRWRVVHNDCVDETRAMQSASVGLVLTSIPFSTQYKYSDSYRDFGHTDSNTHFFQQMDFLTPELFRVLEPGRVALIHVKDRVVPGGLNGHGFQSIYPFHSKCIEHYEQHGFVYMGMVTIVTDVVRENAQTYRLGWTEQTKDGTKQGVGLPEYLLIFRRPPTDPSSAAADTPVVKSKERYTRGRWQVDAHAFWRSDGNRLLTAADLVGLPADQVFKLFSQWSREHVYDHETHVALCDALDAKGKLPPSFMLLQPQSWHPDVWADVARMRTANTLQAQADRVQHLCPLPFDIAERAILRWSMPGERVYDPFGGLQTVPLCAAKHGREGLGVELSPVYFVEGVRQLRALDRQAAVPTLFDLNAVAPGADEDSLTSARATRRGEPDPGGGGAPVRLDAVSPIRVEDPESGTLFAGGRR